MEKLSVVIITFNEEKNIRRCLESVQDVADEIIVSDSFSTDRTEDICNEFDVNFYQKEWEGYSAQKNEANNRASNNLIFSIDADEVLSDKLKKSITEIKLTIKGSAAYKVNRLTNYCGKWIHHCGWYPDTKLRLWFRNEGQWEGELHEEIIFQNNPKTVILEGDLLHYSYYNLEDHYNQVEKFTDIAASDYFNKNRKVSLIKLWLSPAVKFIRDYFFLLGFLDGKSGFRICYISAGATYLKYKKLRKLIKREKINLIELNINIRSSNTENFSIIIPTWNNLEYLKLCIKSLRNNSKYKNQIIVAVNEGKDGTVEWLEKQLDIDYIYAKENLGVCYAVNACRPYITNNYIAYLNDDMYVLPDWDFALRSEIDKLKTDNFFLSATLIEPVKNTNPNYVAIIKDYGDTVETFNEAKLLKDFGSLPMKNWRGSSWPPNVVHKNTWDLVGGYSIEFSPGMYSDPDFSMKLWQSGMRLLYGVGNSRVYHFGEKSTGRVKKNKGSDTFLQKWGLTARTYYSEYLQLGKEYTGKYPDKVELSLITKIRNKLKLYYTVIRF